MAKSWNDIYQIQTQNACTEQSNIDFCWISDKRQDSVSCPMPKPPLMWGGSANGFAMPVPIIRK